MNNTSIQSFRRGFCYEAFSYVECLPFSLALDERAMAVRMGPIATMKVLASRIISSPLEVFIGSN